MDYYVFFLDNAVANLTFNVADRARAGLPLLFHLAIRKTPLVALYVRPKMFRLGNKKATMRAAIA